MDTVIHNPLHIGEPVHVVNTEDNNGLSCCICCFFFIESIFTIA